MGANPSANPKAAVGLRLYFSHRRLIRYLGGASGREWFIPSEDQSPEASGEPKGYRVDLEARTCECPWYEIHRCTCKHIAAGGFAEWKMLNDQRRGQEEEMLA